MEFRLLKASDWDFDEKVTINTLEDLKELQEKYQTEKIPFSGNWYNPSIIIDFNTKEIKIYDYYVE